MKLSDDKPPVFKITISGARGPKGADSTVAGPPGDSAYDLALAAGFIGSEAQWLDSLNGNKGDDGDPGLSAYQVALNNGFAGDEAAWLASLQGEPGEAPTGGGLVIEWPGSEAYGALAQRSYLGVAIDDVAGTGPTYLFAGDVSNAGGLYSENADGSVWYNIYCSPNAVDFDTSAPLWEFNQPVVVPDSWYNYALWTGDEYYEVPTKGDLASKIEEMDTAIADKAPLHTDANWQTAAGARTPDGSKDGMYLQATGDVTINAISGIPTDMQPYVMRIKGAGGAAYTITWNAIYRAMTGVTLPTNVIVGKSIYVTLLYNDGDDVWDVLGVVAQP